MNNYKFTGLEHDSESNLEHTMYRQYEAVQGRWLSPDPYSGSMALTNPQSFNRYSYVLNSPLRAVDPTGLNCVWDDGTMDDAPIDGGIDEGGCWSAHGTWAGETITVSGSGDNGQLLPGDCADVYVDGVYEGTTCTIPSLSGGRNGGGNSGASPGVAQGLQNFLTCVKKGTDYFSLANGVSTLTGGRVGNGLVGSALLGSSASSLITGAQWATTKLTGVPGPSSSETAVALGGEYASDFGIGQVAARVPNIALTAAAMTSTTVATPTASTTVTSAASFTLSLPLGNVAQSVATALGKAGAYVKLPVDVTVAAFSAIVCSAN